MTLKRFAILLATIILPALVRAQEGATVLSNFGRNIADFNELFPQEKVYLHFDNTGYFRGETIWFKAYVVRADNDSLTDLSHVLYVELVSPGGDVLETHKLHIEDGQADGCIKLDKLLESGFYEVRAYTRYMTNWDAAGIFSRVFPIFNAPKKEGDYSKMKIEEHSFRYRLPNYREGDSAKVEKMNVKFYPEGGTLVEGLEQRVAFEATDAAGAHVDAECALLDAKGDTLARVRTLREGRGVFTRPASCQGGTFILRDSLGKAWRFALPQEAYSGCVMRLDVDDGGAYRLKITRNAEYAGSLLGLTLTHNGNVMSFERLKMDGGAVSLTLPRRKLPAGVSELTLFDTDGDIVADRLLFAPPDSSKAAESIGVRTANEYLTPCGKAELELSTRPESTFSLSVRDAATQTNGYAGNAATWLLLTSDLKGFIENPSYYFEADDAEHRRAADLLMMVQGWRRYDWRQMAGKAPFYKREPLEDKMYLDGRLHRYKKKNDVGNVQLTATLYNRKGQSMDGSTTTDENGYYTFSLPDCAGEWTMFLNTKKNGEDTKYFVGINRHFSPMRLAFTASATKLFSAKKPRLMLKEVDMSDKLEKIMKNNYVMPTLTVKAKKKSWTDNARAGWENEARGRYHACLYYNCDDAAEEIADRGEVMPLFYEWLARRNPFFCGNVMAAGPSSDNTAISNSQGQNTSSDAKSNVGHVATESMGNGEIKDVVDREVVIDGMPETYKNRYVAWVINNVFVNDMMRDGYYDVPPNTLSLDDVKSIYISEDPNEVNHFKPAFANERHFFKNKLAVILYPVTVMVYTYHSGFWNVMGLRRTHFQGFDEPAVYEMPDYSVLPPAKDYRRTLYWNPNVTTDKGGRAKVEFYNNSSCRQIVVSAEGITPDGKALVGE
jgi:hypothetical protein